MPQRKGAAKPAGSGRKPGTPNKRTWNFRTEAEAACRKHGFDLLDAIVMQAKGIDPLMGKESDVPGADRARFADSARKSLLHYQYPTLKAIEHLVLDDPEHGRLPAAFAWLDRPVGKEEEQGDMFAEGEDDA